ncbi:MAG: ATP-binding protein, partial [Muribaculaceae bacterium]
MAKIIGRKREIELLDSFYHSGRAEFIAVYGRRRVGKTFLIRQYFKGNFAFDVTGIIEGTRAEQMGAFYTALKSYGYEGGMKSTWIETFYDLRILLESKIKKGERCVIFIDELPCFDTRKAGFVNALGYFWNSWANWQDEIMLVVCGSATSWLVRNIINNHGGLHDRITHEIGLHPFTLAEAEDYFSSNGFKWQRLNVLQAYMAVGGVPYYLSLFEKGESPAAAIDRLFFNVDGELRREYRRLFSSLFRNAQPYIDIINVLVKAPGGMNREEIASAMKCQNNGRLGDMLTDLVYCDFLRKTNVRGKNVKTNDAIYQVIDFYTIFYNSFMSKLGNDENFWTHNANSSAVKVWYGLAFERVCASHVLQIKRAMGISGVASMAYTWRSRKSDPGAQIDLVIERADNVVNICEAKYSGSQYSLQQAEYLKIENRIAAFQEETATKSGLIPTMITTFGLKEGGYAAAIPVSITMDDLF